MQLNHAQRELTLKIVYYGPGLSGKTTNLQQIHLRTRPEVRGRLLTVETRDDRTLFFDLLPVFFTTRAGYKVKVKLFTVPGQVIHNATRRIVLQNADAVAFIADSRRSATADNNAYWHNLMENMRENGLDPAQVPVVIQFNKRDLPDSRTEEEIEQTRARGREAVVGAVAVRGEGVLETFHAVAQAAFRQLEQRHELSRLVGLSEADFLREVFGHLDVRGTGLEPLYGGAPPLAGSGGGRRRMSAAGGRHEGEGQAGGGGGSRRESVLQRKLALGDMLDLPSFSEVVKSFADLYRVGIKVLDARGGKLADVKVGNGDFCGLVFSQPEGRVRCSATVARLKEGPLPGLSGAQPVAEVPPAQGVLSLGCFTGLRYLLMPIRWEGDVLGRVIFGPFTPEELQELPGSLTDIAGLDLARAHAHLAQIRRAPEHTVAQVMAHFAQVLGTLVAAGQKTYLTSQLHIEATLETHRALEEKNERLEAMNARLKELDRLKSSFLATVSHELRTPLTSIIGYSEMLSEGLAGPLNGEQGEYVRTIVDKGEALLKLISSILDISQIEAGKVRLCFEPLDAGDLVANALSSVAPQAQKKGVQLTLRRPEVPQPRVHADRDKLRQVVVNLLANAVKFTPANGTVRVLLSEVAPQPELGGEGYRLVVEDTGVGIPDDQFETIFQSFYQVDNSSTREFGGAGLGLAIVRSFVEGHGGQVMVASQVGKGSRFSVVLPVRPATHAPGPVLIPPPVEPDRF